MTQGFSIEFLININLVSANYCKRSRYGAIITRQLY